MRLGYKCDSQSVGVRLFTLGVKWEYKVILTLEHKITEACP